MCSAAGEPTDVGKLLTVTPVGSGLSLQVQERKVSLLDLSSVLDVRSEELGRASSLLRSSGASNGSAFEFNGGRRVLVRGVTKRFDNLTVHRLDGSLLSWRDGGLRVDELPQFV